MRLDEILSLVRVTKPELRPVVRRLARSHDIPGLRDAARRASPRPIFDYVDGGADDEISLLANLEAFRSHRFAPNALVGVAAVDTSTRLFGRTLGMPMVLAPTGLTRMMNTDGETAVAAAAGRAHLPYALSTFGTTSIADLAAAPHGELWFQLYIGRDRDRTARMVSEAAEHGYEVLVVAVDTPVAGRRLRDVHNGLTLPPALTLSSIAGIGTRPGYWIRMLRSSGMSFPNINGGEGLKAARMWLDPEVTWDDLAAIRERWPGQLLVKGPLGAADARRAVDAGADGVQLSNHGGRQLDRTIPPIDLVQGVRAAVGPDIAVLVDSGVRNGADLAIAVALGADAVGIGRAYLYGLMAGGEAGVDRALTILSSEFQRTMRLLGVASVAQLAEQGASLLARGDQHFTREDAVALPTG